MSVSLDPIFIDISANFNLIWSDIGNRAGIDEVVEKYSYRYEHRYKDIQSFD